MAFATKAWKNAPTETTPLSAEAMIDLEQRLAAYTDVLHGLLPVFNVKDSVYGAKGDGSTNDVVAIQAAVDAANAAGGGVVYFPAGTYIVKSALELQSNVTLQGAGWAASIIKVGKEAKCTAITTKKFESGGIENPGIADLQINGNLAENTGFTGDAVQIDSVNPVVQRVWIKNGHVNLYTTQSAEDKASTRPEDGIFNDMRLYDSKAFNWYFEGPHDSQISKVLAKTNEGVNLAVHRVSVWSCCHAYGNAEYAWELAGGTLLGCIGEGATKAQCIVLGDGQQIFSSEFFSAGEKDGKVGIKFGDGSHTAFSTQIEGVRIEGCSNGALDFTSATASGSRIGGWIAASSGEAIKGSPSSSVQLDIVLRGGISLGATPSCPTVASATEIEVPNLWFSRHLTTKISGTAEIKKVKVAAAGTLLTMIFTSTAKVVDGENLKLASTFTATADDTLTLVCDGANWYETGRSAN